MSKNEKVLILLSRIYFLCKQLSIWPIPMNMVYCYQCEEVERGMDMAISYNKLWKLLIDKKMNKMDLRLTAGVSTSVIAKLGKRKNVTTAVLQKICVALHCDICDIMEMEDETNN